MATVRDSLVSDLKKGGANGKADSIADSLMGAYSIIPRSEIPSARYVDGVLTVPGRGPSRPARVYSDEKRDELAWEACTAISLWEAVDAVPPADQEMVERLAEVLARVSLAPGGSMLTVARRLLAAGVTVA